jgi:hypothetical protein
MISDELRHKPKQSFSVIKVNTENDPQHRHEDRHGVYVEGSNNGLNAQHIHEDSHAVYVAGSMTNIDTIQTPSYFYFHQTD